MDTQARRVLDEGVERAIARVVDASPPRVAERVANALNLVMRHGSSLVAA